MKMKRMKLISFALLVSLFLFSCGEQEENSAQLAIYQNSTTIFNNNTTTFSNNTAFNNTTSVVFSNQTTLRFLNNTTLTVPINMTTTWKVDMQAVNEILISESEINLIGANSGGLLKIEKRSLADPSIVLWIYEADDIYAVKESSVFADKRKEKISGGAFFQEGGQLMIYAYGVSKTPYYPMATWPEIVFYDYAWRVVKIDSSGNLVWSIKSDITFPPQCNACENMGGIGITNDAVYLGGDDGGSGGMPYRRLEKRDKTTGDLIWSFRNSPMTAVSFSANSEKYCFAGYIFADPDMIISLGEKYQWAMTCGNLSDGATLWYQQSNPSDYIWSDMFNPDIAKKALIGNNFVVIAGSQACDSGSCWRIEKRQLESGELLSYKMIEGLGWPTDGLIDSDGFYLIGSRSEKPLIEKYDFDLNIIWSTYIDSGVSAIAKTGNYIYVAGGGYLSYLDSAIGERK